MQSWEVVVTEKWHMKDGTVLNNVHPGFTCVSKFCVIHNPSNHHMKDWPLRWVDGKGLFERVCLHGVRHPDPDDIHAKVLLGQSATLGVHGCCEDLCCVD